MSSKLLSIVVLVFLLGGGCGGEGREEDKLQSVNPLATESIKIQNLKEFVKDADYICSARVLEVISGREQYDPQANLVMSRIRLEILENWKGHLASEIEMRSFGGVLDGIPYFAAEFPRFEKGEEIVLFLKNFGGDLFPLQHARGKRQVKHDWIEEEEVSLSEFRRIIIDLRDE